MSGSIKKSRLLKIITNIRATYGIVILFSSVVFFYKTAHTVAIMVAIQVSNVQYHWLSTKIKSVIWKKTYISKGHTPK